MYRKYKYIHTYFSCQIYTSKMTPYFLQRIDAKKMHHLVTSLNILVWRLNLQDAHVNIMMFSKAECKALHLSWSSPRYVYRWRITYREQPCQEGLGVLVDEKVNTSQQCVLAAHKSSCILDYTKR